MKWMSLFPEELQPGDYVCLKDDSGWIESLEPMESSMEVRIVFQDGDDKIWPWRAPIRVGRPEGPKYMEDVSVNPKIL
jgi:hypothetical protein